MKHNLRGQISLELLITLGIIIAFTVPIVFLLLSVTSVGYEKAARDQADASARSLSDTINIVYAQGNGAKRIILLNLPSSTDQLKVSASEVSVIIKISSGTYEGVSPVFGNVETFDLSGANKKTGLFAVSVENVKGKVRLSESK